MPREPIDMTGDVVNGWLVLARAHTKGSGNWYWTCLCDCGVTQFVSGKSLRSGDSKRCRSCAAIQRHQKK